MGGWLRALMDASVVPLEAAAWHGWQPRSRRAARQGHPSTSHGLGVSRGRSPAGGCEVEGMHAPFCWCRAVPCEQVSRAPGRWLYRL
jgi:hypothetical protein